MTPTLLATTPGNTQTLPLTKITINANADADTHIGSFTAAFRFTNPLDSLAELTYTLPLPASCNVHTARARFGNTVLVCQLHERAAARAAYQQAVADGIQTALVEADRDDVFCLSLGSVPGGCDVIVEIECDVDISVDANLASLRLPLTLASRYHGKGSSDPQRVAVEHVKDSGLRVDVTASIVGGTEQLRCDSHDAARVRDGVITLDGIDADRDVTIRWEIPGTRVHRATWAKDQTGDGGTLLVELLEQVTRKKRTPVDVALLLDRSGSMNGWKIVAARRAAARLAGALTDSDRLWFAAFDHELDIHPFCDGGITAADGECRAEIGAWCQNLDAYGGTEIGRPLEIAAAALGTAEKGRERVLVLITDGQVTNEAALLKLKREQLSGVRIITVGIDSAVAAGLLERLASSGECSIVERPERLDEVLHRIVRSVAGAVIRNVRVKGAELTEQAPAGSLDAHPMSLRRIWLRTSKEMPTTVTVHGDGGYTHQLDVSECDDSARDGIRRSWARERVRVLENAWNTTGDDEHRQAMIAVSLAHGVLCRQTAFVAIDETGAVQPGVQPIIRQPHTQPWGWNIGAARSQDGPLARTSVRHSIACMNAVSSTITLAGGMSDAAPIWAAVTTNAAMEMLAPAMDSTSTADLFFQRPGTDLETSAGKTQDPTASALRNRVTQLLAAETIDHDELWQLIDDIRLHAAALVELAAVIDALDRHTEEQQLRLALGQLADALGR